MSGALRIEMGVLFVTDRERIMVPTWTSTSLRVFGNIVGYPEKKKTERPGRNVILDHMSVRSTCYQLSGTLNGSVHRQLSLETHEWTFYERRRRPTINVNSGKYQARMKRLAAIFCRRGPRLNHYIWLIRSKSKKI